MKMGNLKKMLPGAMDVSYSIEYHCFQFKYIESVGNVFRLPIRQNKFFGTIEFFVSILDLNIQICRPFVPWKISYMPIEYLVLEIIICVYDLPFPFCIIDHNCISART